MIKINLFIKKKYLFKIQTHTSPHLPTTSNKSFLPSDKSTIHLLTAFDDRSGVKSSSAISTHPNERTANLIGLESESDLSG